MKKITFDKKTDKCNKCGGIEFKTIQKLSEEIIIKVCKQCGNEKTISQPSEKRV